MEEAVARPQESYLGVDPLSLPEAPLVEIVYRGVYGRVSPRPPGGVLHKLSHEPRFLPVTEPLLSPLHARAVAEPVLFHGKGFVGEELGRARIIFYQCEVLLQEGDGGADLVRMELRNRHNPSGRVQGASWTC